MPPKFTDETEKPLKRANITPNDVRKWFKDEFHNVKISPLMAASISGTLESLSMYPIKERDRPEWPAARHARGLKLHLPAVIEYYRKMAETRDSVLQEKPGTVPEWYFVNSLLELSNQLDCAFPLITKRRSKRTAWHVRAAQIEDVITATLKRHGGQASFSRAADRPLVRVIAHALEAMGEGSHSAGAIADAITKIPAGERMSIVG